MPPAARPRSDSPAEPLVRAAAELARKAGALRFAGPVALVYNPLDYARAAHEQYLRRYAVHGIQVLFVGMNPGPWGMAQTGIPFGDVETVREWLRIDAHIGSPAVQHPERPILGLSCPRVEVSGKRLWGLARERFGTPAAFFRRHFVANYCPLAFLEQSGRNRTPDKLPAAEREELFEVCDDHLEALISNLGPRWVVGVGNFAYRRVESVLASRGDKTARAALIPHPSPASPRANAGWAAETRRCLEEMGIW